MLTCIELANVGQENDRYDLQVTLVYNLQNLCQYSDRSEVLNSNFQKNANHKFKNALLVYQ
jgi:hypothetical protein